MTEERRLRETQNAKNGAKSSGRRERGADSSEPRVRNVNRASANHRVEVDEEPDNARKRDQALRKALKRALAKRTLEQSRFGIAVDRAVPKSQEKPASGSGAVDDQVTVDIRKRPAASPGTVDDQTTLDMIRTPASDNHYRIAAVRDAIATEWALDKPVQEKIDNAIDLALFFYRTVMKGDTRQTLGLVSIKGFLSDVRLEVLDLLRPNDDLTGVERALLVISTLGRDNGWKWADDVTLALFVCENEGFADKAQEISKTLPMLIDRRKLVALRKMF